MVPIRIYLYSNCSSCRTAESILKDSGIAYDRRDIFREKLNAEEIQVLLGEIGKSAFDILSRRSIPYRQLDLANRSIGEAELIELMSEYPGLLKRPIIVAGETSQVGFNRTALQALVAS